MGVRRCRHRLTSTTARAGVTSGYAEDEYGLRLTLSALGAGAERARSLGRDATRAVVR